MNKSITNVELKNIFGDEMIVVEYDKLHKITSFDDFFDKHPYLTVLYEYKPNYGHWILLLKTKCKTGNTCLEYFDSYGNKPDQALKKFPKEIRDNYGMRNPVLSELMIRSKYPLEYNNHRLQKIDDKISTCGRWVAARAALSHLDIDSFAKLFKGKNQSPDEIVTKFSKKYLKL